MLTEYQKAPAVTRDRLYIETMQQVYSNVSKVMVDSRNGSNLLYLPLDKLMQQATASPVVAAPAAPAVPKDANAPVVLQVKSLAKSFFIKQAAGIGKTADPKLLQGFVP